MASMGLFDRGGQDEELLVVKEHVKNTEGTTVTEENLIDSLLGRNPSCPTCGVVNDRTTSSTIVRRGSTTMREAKKTLLSHLAGCRRTGYSQISEPCF